MCTDEEYIRGGTDIVKFRAASFSKTVHQSVTGKFEVFIQLKQLFMTKHCESVAKQNANVPVNMYLCYLTNLFSYTVYLRQNVLLLSQR